MNEKKTEVMAFNTQGSLISRNGQVIKQVDDFKYLGSYLSNSTKDINVRIGCAWAAIKKLDSLWQSKLPRAYKIMFWLEEAASKVGLLMNEKKTEVMAFNTQSSLISRSGQVIKQVDDFKYLGSYLSNSTKDINVRIGCAWAAIRKLDSLWQSNF